jgi:hypothetical protein
VTSLSSTITCPVCGHRKAETMPTDACQYFYDCEGCQAILKPKPGDCCVFCSYGDVPCPPIQAARLGKAEASCCADAKPERTGASKDWVGSAQSFAVAWGLPMGLIIIGLFVSPNVRTVLWTVALIWMGGACLLNAQRCQRTHCRFTGPYYLAMVLPVLLLGSGAISVGFYGWLALGALILVGSKIIWWASERVLGQYSS